MDLHRIPYNGYRGYMGPKEPCYYNQIERGTNRRQSSQVANEIRRRRVCR